MKRRYRRDMGETWSAIWDCLSYLGVDGDDKQAPNAQATRTYKNAKQEKKLKKTVGTFQSREKQKDVQSKEETDEPEESRDREWDSWSPNP